MIKILIGLFVLDAFCFFLQKSQKSRSKFLVNTAGWENIRDACGASLRASAPLLLLFCMDEWDATGLGLKHWDGRKDLGHGVIEWIG